MAERLGWWGGKFVGFKGKLAPRLASLRKALVEGPSRPRLKPWRDRSAWSQWVWIAGFALLALWLVGPVASRTFAAAATSDWEAVRSGLIALGAAVGAPFLAWRTILAAQQTHINQQTHFTNLYSKAVEMLGADKVVKEGGRERSVPNIEVRLGAIYALERIARESDADHRPIVETLCAYIRQNLAPPLEHDIPDAPEPPEDETPEARAERLEAVAARVQALKALVPEWRRWAVERGRATISRPDIRGALDVLTRREDATRLKAEKIGPAPPVPALEKRLERSSPEAARARLKTIEERSTVLRAWNAAQAVEDAWRPDLSGAALQGVVPPHVDFRRIDLSGARMEGAALWRAHMEGADLRRAHMEGADLSGARMEGADLWEAYMEGADLSGTHIEGTDLIRARMEGAVFREARMEGTVLWEAHMEGADLTRAHLEGAVFWKAHMEGAILSKAHLEGAAFWEAHVEGADLSGAHMEATDLSGAYLKGAEVCGAHLAGSMLASTDFTNARNLTYGQLASAFGDAGTVLPERVDDKDAKRVRARLVAEAGWAAETLEDWHDSMEAWAAWRKARGLPPHRWHTPQ